VTRTSTNPIALIDGDILVYRAAFNEQEQLDWGSGPTTTVGSLTEAQDILGSLIREWAEMVSPKARVVVTLSDANGCFRNDLYSFYKAGRKERPALYHALREWVSKNYETFLRDDLEADDVLGILATSNRLGPGRKVIVTKDKDLLGVPACVMRVPEHEVVVSKADADYFHLFQTLTGDTVDNYPGCPGIGPVKAALALSTAREGSEFFVDAGWDAVVTTYNSRGKTPEDALLQARLARILRASDYDFINKRPILWTPPPIPTYGNPTRNTA
jgi:DNA polymerase I